MLTSTVLQLVTKFDLVTQDLFAEIESDYAVYGDECVFHGGKVLRQGMGQACGCNQVDCLDTVITNAVIIDFTGIFKADIGIKEGIIVSLGKAGNPDVMKGVMSNMIVGVNTEVIVGEGMIVTAGAVESCAFHMPTIGTRGYRKWYHHNGGRWNWTCPWDSCYRLYTGTITYEINAAIH